MKYSSTRNSSIDFSFEDALCLGYAPDRGLFVPQVLPSVNAELLRNWARLPYPELAYHVLRGFISPQEVSDVELNNVCTSAFDGFEDPQEAVPIVSIGSLYVAELFHGPTFCFKDLGMRGVVNLLSLFASKRQKPICLIVSTTGDTGPAAVRAVSDIGNPLLTILVHYPEGQISDFQRRQMTTVDSTCVHIVAFEGGGDDMDRPIKNMLTGQDSNGPILWTGVNSYNIGRPIFQMVHFIWTYLRVCEKEKIPIGDPTRVVDIVLPTGALGNLAGGYMAKKMGIPLGTLHAGVNINNITDRVIRTGMYHRSAEMYKTMSDAINIQVPYNMERIFYYMTDGNAELVRNWMTQMEQTSKIDLNEEWLAKLQNDFHSATVTDDEMCTTVRMFHQQHDYLCDPHTAVALCAAEKLGFSVNETSHTNPVAVLATAMPCKFKESIAAAIGPDKWEEYTYSRSFPVSAAEILSKPERSISVHRATLGRSLDDIQSEWEASSRKLVESFSKSIC